MIGSYIGLRFFLRRTLGGCEFGVCLDFDFHIPSDKKQHDCLIDQDPLLLFTICVKSMAPILAGILIIGLVYIVSLSSSIAEWISSFPTKITRTIVKKTLTEVASVILSSQIELICDKVCSFLMKILSEQVLKMSKYDSKIAGLFQILMQIASQKSFSNVGDKFGELFKDKVSLKVGNNFGQMFIDNNLPFANFVKIGLNLMLCFASFMINFHLHHRSIQYNESKVAEEYDKKQNTTEIMEKNKDIVKKNDIGDEMNELDLKK